jgi:hypothetical protein
MAFRIRQSVDQWFKHIGPKNNGTLKTKFDLFYLCLLLGLADGKPEKVENAPEFVNNFVTEYQGVQNIIIGLMILAELSRQGINAEEKESVRKVFSQYVDPKAPANLSDAGESKLNEYASRGFDILSKEIPTVPYDETEFLRQYVPVLRKTIDNNKMWSI